MDNIIAASIKERLRKVIAKELKVAPETIADDAHIGKDLGIDSADMISVLYDIEEEFEVEISDEEVGEISTIREMFNVVNGKIKQV
ncbi:acyl carrier protein [Candidatus Scalindua japonica]|uniref:Acyl carrier protein n=1 Tax=Candidatus Scalindua japonica TaxID=1284222 RepID=A0A286TZH7_9BACT|nr:acyl carrier protein [Candidatus Scalindua japonica]GAX61290.1 acyl carrier protein [Candidatus Scalindua japonica]